VKVKVKVEKEEELKEEEEEAISYTEGRLDKAEYDLSGSWASHLYTSEDAARAGCDAEDNCLGYWLQRGSGKYRTLYVGKRSWAAGVPNGSVVSVKVKGSAGAPVSSTTEPSKCWRRMPVCNKALSETQTPSTWFVDPWSTNSGTCSSRVSDFARHCQVDQSSIESSWSAGAPVSTTAEPSKCWRRMSVCNKALSETETPSTWFVDPRSPNSGACSGRASAYARHCQVDQSTIESSWSASAPVPKCTVTRDGPYTLTRCGNGKVEVGYVMKGFDIKKLSPAKKAILDTVRNGIQRAMAIKLGLREDQLVVAFKAGSIIVSVEVADDDMPASPSLGDGQDTLELVKATPGVADLVEAGKSLDDCFVDPEPEIQDDDASDEASATGDPHIVSVSGETFDMSPSLLK